MLLGEDFSHWRLGRLQLRIAAPAEMRPGLALTEDAVLKWIVGSKVDHPLADAKQARTLIAELPPYDAVKALDEITGWLESLPEAEGFKLDRMFEVIDLLDLASKNHQ